MTIKQKDEVVPTTAYVMRKKDRYDPETKTKKDLGTSSATEILAVQKFVVEPARVDKMIGMTVNLGAYESATVRVGLTLPCYVEEIDKAYKYVEGWVSSRLSEEVDALRKEAHKRALDGVDD